MLYLVFEVVIATSFLVSWEVAVGYFKLNQMRTAAAAATGFPDLGAGVKSRGFGSPSLSELARTSRSGRCSAIEEVGAGWLVVHFVTEEETTRV